MYLREHGDGSHWRVPEVYTLRYMKRVNTALQNPQRPAAVGVE